MAAVTEINSFTRDKKPIWQNLNGTVLGSSPLYETNQQYAFLRNIPYLPIDTKDPLSSKIIQSESNQVKSKFESVKKRQFVSQQQLLLNTKNIQGNSVPTYDDRNRTLDYFKLKKPFQIPVQVWYVAGALGVMALLSR